MDSHSSSTYLLNHDGLSSLYYQSKEENGSIIDLGLSLKVLQPEAYHHSGHAHDGYGDLAEWNQLHPLLKSSNVAYPRESNEEVVHGTKNLVQRREQCYGYVKVHMDGVLVGRKICMLDHPDYISLGFQLEDMFGTQSLCGLRLFQSGSEFSLLYKDRNEQWRTVGDVPWKEFVDCVKRLRIMPKNDILFPTMTASI